MVKTMPRIEDGKKVAPAASGFGRRMAMEESTAKKAYAEFVDERQTEVLRLKEKFEKNAELALGKGKLDDLFTSNPRKAENLVLFLEATERDAFANPALIDNMKTYKSLKEARLSEDVVGPGSNFLGITPMDIVKIARIGYPNSVAPDLFDFWGMKSMKDSIYKLQTLYGSTARGATKDQVIYENYNDGRYATNIEKYDVSNAATDTFTGDVGTDLLLPFQVKVYVNGVQVAQDDGAGHFVGASLNLAGPNTINYDTGAFALKFTTALSASDDIYIEYGYNFEDTSMFSKVGSVLLDLVVYDYRATMWPLSVEWTRFTEELMQSKLGMSAKDQLLTGAAEIMRKGMDEFCITKGIGASKWTSAVPFNTDFASAGAHDAVSHAQNVIQPIVQAEMKTYTEVGRLPDKTNMIVDAPAYSYLSKHNKWNSVNAPSKVGIFKVGTLDSRDVYMAPPNIMGSEANKGKIYLFGKSSDAMNVDSVISVGTWKASVTTNPIELKNFNSQMGLAFMGDVRRNNPKFATSIELTNLTANS